jgi:hypothetical protein
MYSRLPGIHRNDGWCLPLHLEFPLEGNDSAVLPVFNLTRTTLVPGLHFGLSLAHLVLLEAQ